MSDINAIVGNFQNIPNRGTLNKKFVLYLIRRYILTKLGNFSKHPTNGKHFDKKFVVYLISSHILTKVGSFSNHLLIGKHLI